MSEVSLSRCDRTRKLKDARRELCGRDSRTRFSVYCPRTGNIDVRKMIHDHFNCIFSSCWVSVVYTFVFMMDVRQPRVVWFLAELNPNPIYSIWTIAI